MSTLAAPREPRFHTEAGWLTPYALQCGYQEIREIGPVVVSLYYEHGTFHVRSYDHGLHKRLAWDVFASIVQARARFVQLRREARQLTTERSTA